MKLYFFVTAVLIKVLFIKAANGETAFEESEKTLCGNIFVEKQVILTSENYPFPYSPNKECFYLLKGNNCTTHYNLEFRDFNVETSKGCTRDRLEIGHQDALCGMKNGSKIYSAEQGGSLKLKFISSQNDKQNKGFKLLIRRIDACDINNSSAESNITLDNRDVVEITTNPSLHWWTTKRPLRPDYLPATAQQCCQNNIFSSKRFLLLSPNFPYSSGTPTDCIYIVKKASSQVCRLRINVLFFSLGPPSNNSCPYGHLEIDGKYICGCNADLKLMTNFRGLESKLLRYRSSGYNTGDFFGFVLEIIQDECPKRYSPEDGVLAERSSGNFRFYDDQDNKVSWPQNRNIDQLKLVNERVHLIPQEENQLERKFGNIFKHFYFFAPENEEDISWTQQEKEETNYIEISTINTLLTDLHKYQQCIQWNRNQMFILNKRFGNSLNQMCKSLQEDNDISNCMVLSSFNGNIRSPGYPLAYPPHQNICYRFQLLPGYCAVGIDFKDFQIETSYDCLKDYLSINKYRYCGNYLLNKQVTINAQGKSHQDVNFITDANYCGKGFSAFYQQVPCQKSNYPVTPNNCNPGGENTRSPLNCEKHIREKYFIIQYEAGAEFCSFNIRKFSEDVCKIKLYFEHFTLPCTSESITIDGQTYCGEISGKTVIFDIQEEKTIIYKRNYFYGTTTNDYPGNFLIHGTQINDDCESSTPEPVRLTLDHSSNYNLLFANNELEKKSYRNKFPDICKLIKNNVTTEELPKKICDLLTKYQNVTDCQFSKAYLEDISSDDKNITKIRLTSGKTKELKYREIECQN